MYGTTAKILRVDLTHNTIQTETLSEDFYRMYPGGKALVGYILLNEIPPHTDPFAPENVLVFAAGLLTGAPVSTATRYVVSARSPLTGGYGESEAGLLGAGTQNGRLGGDCRQGQSAQAGVSLVKRRAGRNPTRRTPVGQVYR